MTVHVNVFTKQERAVAGRILTSHHDRTESVRSYQNDYLNNFVAPVKSVELGSRSGPAVLTSLARREMTGSLDSDGIILLDNLKKAPHNLNSNQKSTGVNSASSETNQLWLQMRKRRAEPLPLHADDLASLTDKADAISLSLPAAHQIEGSADITSIYRMNLESQRLSNSKPSLNGQLLPDLTVRRDQPTRFDTGPPSTSKANTNTNTNASTEVSSPYNSDHCLTSAVIYPQDSATLRETNVMRYERNPMIYNPSLGKNRISSSLIKKKGENSSDSVVDDAINSYDYESLYQENDDNTNDSSIKSKKLIKKEKDKDKDRDREGYGSIIESLSYKLALQIESLQASIIKKDEKIEELEKAALEQLNNEFNYKIAKMKSDVSGKEKEIRDMSDRSDETDNKLSELLLILETRENNFMTKEECGTFVKEHSSLHAEIELLKNRLYAKECSAIKNDDVVSASTSPVFENDDKKEQITVFTRKILSLQRTILNLENQLNEKSSGNENENENRKNIFSQKNSIDPTKENKNVVSITTLEKLNNNEVVTINYTVEEIDNIINKFPIGIDSKGKLSYKISLIYTNLHFNYVLQYLYFFMLQQNKPILI